MVLSLIEDKDVAHLRRIAADWAFRIVLPKGRSTFVCYKRVYPGEVYIISYAEVGETYVVVRESY